MATAQQRNYVQLVQLVPQLDTLDEARDVVQQLVNAVHELNARVYFLQDRLQELAAYASFPLEQLEDY